MFRQPAIFLYHELCDSLDDNEHIRRFDIRHSLKQFETHISAIAARYDLISTDSFLEGCATGIDMSSCALITFDDGYYSSCLHGMSILERYKCGGIWFINSDFSSNTGIFWLTNLIENFILNKDVTAGLLGECLGKNHGFEKMSSNTFNDVIKNFYCEELAAMCDLLPCVISNEKAYLSADDIREFSTLRNCCFANHTASHPNISKVGRSRLCDELQGTRDFLATAGVGDGGMFAIPFGLYGQHWGQCDIEDLKEMNYSHIFSVNDASHPEVQSGVYMRHQVPTYINSKLDMSKYLQDLQCS